MARDGFKRKLTAILSADVEGYSRLMEDDKEATVKTLTVYREVITSLIQQHNGVVLDAPGDNLLAEFASVVDAVQGAVAVQKEIKTRNAELPDNRKMRFRIKKAFELAQKARSMDDSFAGAYLLLAYVILWKDRQHEQAIAAAEKAKIK